MKGFNPFQIGVDIFQAKILRMTQDPDAAIAILQDGLKPDRESTFQQADALVCYSYYEARTTDEIL